MQTADLDLDHPWSHLFPAQLRLDPTSALDRLLVEHIGDVLATIEPARLAPPMTKRSRQKYETFALNFERWCVHENFTETIGEASTLPPAELRLAVEEWLHWRVTPVGPDHPLTVNQARRRGDLHEKGWRETGAHGSAAALKSAMRLWAAIHGINEVVSAKAEMITEPERAVRPARDLTDSEIVAVVEALLSEPVVRCRDDARLEAWRVRQLAMFNISVAASLRQCELSMLLDHNVTSIDSDGIKVRLPRTKQHPEGRVVHLRPRGDALCPVWALTRWLQLCADRNWNRGGLLLPAVVQIRVNAIVKPSKEHERRAWRLITDHLGITDDVESGLRSTPHGLRSIALTRAVEAGWDHHDLMRLGDWASLQTALTYDRRMSPPAAFVTSMAQDLGSFGDTDGAN